MARNVSSKAADVAEPQPFTLPPPLELFATSDMGVAAYIVASEQGLYIGARHGYVGPEFRLGISPELGAKLADEYRTDSGKPVIARRLLRAHKFLRNEASKLRAEVADVRPVR